MSIASEVWLSVILIRIVDSCFFLLVLPVDSDMDELR